MLAHGLPAAIICSTFMAVLARRHWRVFGLSFLTFHLHLLCDLIAGSRGPDKGDLLAHFLLRAVEAASDVVLATSMAAGRLAKLGYHHGAFRLGLVPRCQEGRFICRRHQSPVRPGFRGRFAEMARDQLVAARFFRVLNRNPTRNRNLILGRMNRQEIRSRITITIRRGKSHLCVEGKLLYLPGIMFEKIKVQLPAAEEKVAHLRRFL
jgi:hypothetical protein